jgi:hypothetical protein
MPAERAGRFRYGFDPLFLACLGAYALNRLVIKPHLHTYSPFFHGHFDDALTVPVALPLFLGFYRLIGLRPDDAPPRWWEVALHTALWIVFFKWFGPVRLHVSQCDPVDMLAIAAGGAAAWLIWRLAAARPLTPLQS